MSEEKENLLRCPNCGKRHDWLTQHGGAYHDSADICQCKEGWLGKLLGFLAVPVDGFRRDK